MTRCRYFTDEEVQGLIDDICYKIDRARQFFDAPIIMTCGYRTPEHNAEIGGAPKSAHVLGMAVDIRAPQDPAMREKLMWALGAAGFRRVESAPKHFHADVANDEDHPNPCWWQGDDK